MASRREMVAAEIRQVIESLTDDGVLNRSPLAGSLLAAAYQARSPGDSPAEAVRRALRDCWMMWACRIGQEMRLRETGRSELAQLKRLMWTGVRYGLAPECGVLDRSAYAAWMLNTAALEQFLYEVTGRGTTAWQLQAVREVVSALHRGHLLGARRHLLETTEDELRSRPEASGLHAFRDRLASPGLNEKVWGEAVEALKAYLAQEYERPDGKWAAPFAYRLLHPKAEEAPKLHALPKLDALLKDHTGFYSIPPESTASEWLSSGASELATVWNENENALAESCEARCRAARKRADAWRSRWQWSLRVTIAIVAALIVALIIFQAAAVHAWLKQPGLTRALGEIIRVAERYPQLPPLGEVFSLGETLRRLWPILPGYFLLELMILGSEAWVERAYKRRLATLQEWESDPQAYVRRAVQEGKIELPTLPAAGEGLSEVNPGQP